MSARASPGISNRRASVSTAPKTTPPPCGHRCTPSIQQQAGGMRYVPRDVISGEFMYDYIDPAVFRCLDERIKSGGIAFDDYVALRDEPLNSPGIGRLLEYFSVEDDYELGDALLFDKYVIHRSVKLGEGELETRDAFSLRFIADDSRYDLA